MVPAVLSMDCCFYYNGLTVAFQKGLIVAFKRALAPVTFGLRNVGAQPSKLGEADAIGDY